MHAEFNLLHKTEIRIAPVVLNGVDLSAVADCVSRVLGLSREEVYVIDAIGEVLSLDILRENVDPRQIAGKREALFSALSSIPGIGMSEHTTLSSDGILGWIGMEQRQSEEILARTDAMVRDINERICRRLLVFSTGAEVIAGQIVDTNKPYITQQFRDAGFSVTSGPDLDDKFDEIAGALRRAVEEGGYGLIITTGGVGAEGKDCTIEALLSVDPEAATPTILGFEQGKGRHAKTGVRIGVGRVGITTLVSLPGPHDEVRIGIAILRKGLAEGKGKLELANDIATGLRARFMEKMAGRVHGHSGQFHAAS
jgi:molybdenum cofactor synthesis domain-containing protein